MQNLELQHLDQASISQTQLTIDALARIAPSCITEVKDSKTGSIKHAVDFKVLRQLLGDNAVEDAPEAYEFTWVGKQEARREAAKSIHKTLRPVPEDSVDWDNTQNIYIEGDNLEALKLLQKSYLGKVKMIYIDPPYNTGNDFVYHDDFKVGQNEYDEKAGNVDEEGNRLVSRGDNDLDDVFLKNTDTNGRFHSDWCSMIYSRLMIARSLLTEDGVIFISIDDNEVENLRKICDEVFGEVNFIGNLSVENNPKGRKNSAFVSVSSEYCMIYAKIKEQASFLENIPKKASDMILDEDGKYVHGSGKRVLVGENSFNKKVTNSNSDKNYSVYYNASTKELITKKELIDEIDESLINQGFAKYFSHDKGKLVENTYTEEKFKELYSQKALQFSNNKIYEKNFNDTIRIKSQLVNKEYEAIVKGVKKKWSMELTTTGAGTQLKTLFNMNDVPFTAPKNIGFIKVLTTLFDKNDMTILDFFSGSATTAHAVMQLNAEDGGNRRFIMVQLPEETAEDSEAYKAGYKNICEIGKERIRRAGKKIKEELASKNKTTKQEGGLFDDKAKQEAEESTTLDTGFRVFRIDSGNMKENLEQTPADIDQMKLDFYLDNVKDDRTELDLLFGCMLNWGVQLSLPMSMETVDGCNIYTVNDGDLVACLTKDQPITENIVKAIAEKTPLRVLFRDGSFASDASKINIFEQFKQLMDWSDDEIIKNVRVL